jgi:hypothetical protein
LFHAEEYAVQSSVPLDVFETFVQSLNSRKLTVTKDNAASLFVLALLNRSTVDPDRLG